MDSDIMITSKMELVHDDKKVMAFIQENRQSWHGYNYGVLIRDTDTKEPIGVILSVVESIYMDGETHPAIRLVEIIMNTDITPSFVSELVVRFTHLTRTDDTWKDHLDKPY